QQIKKSSALKQYLQTGTQLAVEPNSAALDYFRSVPLLDGHFSTEKISEWARFGGDLAKEDYLAGTEYFKAGPAILPVIDSSLLAVWGKIGLLLSKEDTRSKTFYALEYFRTSPEILSGVRRRSLQPQILKIGQALALQAAEETIGYFKAIPGIFFNLEQEEGIHLIFSLADEIVSQAPFALIDFLKHATDILKMMDRNLHSLNRFVQGGLKIKAPPEAVKAYFSLQSKRAMDILNELSQTAFLPDSYKRLKFFAEMITGCPVEIVAGPIPSSRIKENIGVITLPEKISVYPEKGENLKLYKMMTLHEAAHIEFGTYIPLSAGSMEKLQTLDPVLAQNLWTIVEESRIDHLLREAYPGAVRDLHPIMEAQKNNRPDLFNLPPEKGVLEALFQLSIHEEILIPVPIINQVSRLFSILKTIWRSDATVEDTLTTLCRLYEEYRSIFPKFEKEEEKRTEILSPEASLPHYGNIPESRLSHHGLITPEMAFQSEASPDQSSEQINISDKPSAGEAQDQFLRLNNPRKEESSSKNQTIKAVSGNYFLYDEWDWMSRNYKPNWCKLVEKEFNQPGWASHKMEMSYGAVLSIRRYFEKLKPENYRKIKKERDGDEIDFDRLIDIWADIRAGISPDENIYIRREKKERKISTAFLIDLSGSTRQQIAQTEKRIIDIEKEGLLLMIEALNSIGDEYGLFGFSGQSRNQVEFYTIKGFDEKGGSSLDQRIGALEPLKQNRDGTAIRHLIRKLAVRESKIKLLIILSDGKPLDDDYQEMYALEDTKMALREAKNKGIHPFCITVDKQANEYIRKMYQDVNYTFISDIQTLPYKLPQIYKKLTT
ncbi:MAG: VWA domain-containing protein, partial [Nitrospirae bacterium]|nr:VWA domain-containing protein [Nitrospirota bacterium]